MLTRRTVILAKLETTYGVDATPAAADAIEVGDPAISPSGEMLERNILRESLSPVGHIIGLKQVELSFQTEMKGSGVAGDTAPLFGRLLQGCAMKETAEAGVKHDYDPVSAESDFKSLTTYVYVDGILHKVLGCIGSPEIVLEAGQFGKINWTFQGLYSTPIDQALVTPSISETTKPPLLESTNFSMGGYSPIAQALQLSINNEIANRADINAAQGLKGKRIVGRAPAGSFNPEAVLEATNTFWNDWENAVEQALTITIGSVAGNKIVITAPKCLYDSLAWGDRDGSRIYDIPFKMVANAAAGDDEIKISAQ